MPIPVARLNHAVLFVRDAERAAEFYGRLFGFEVVGKEMGGQANLLWPSSFRAVAPPLAILGESGRAIIHEGDTVDLGVADGRGAIPGCPVRGVFLVGEISSVNGEEWPDGAPAPPPRDHPPGNPD